MIHESDVHDLQQELEDLKSQQVTGTLTEQQVWNVMRHASSLLDQAEDSPFKGCIEVIFHLLSSIWTTTRNQIRLKEMKQSIAG
ncbi:hypothetical protein JD969_04130 [Planctomycetota bacterium]|nr:hypothetical protein JD969_04130 [Planctomycetota bacterium]